MACCKVFGAFMVQIYADCSRVSSIYLPECVRTRMYDLMNMYVQECMKLSRKGARLSPLQEKQIDEEHHDQNRAKGADDRRPRGRVQQNREVHSQPGD